MPHSATTLRSLNAHQHQLLQLLYLFRFATARLVAEQQGAKHTRVILDRLKILVDQGYIGMNYDSSYKLQGKPASYYLLPKSFSYLKTKPFASPGVIKSIYYDRKADELQIAHYLHVFSAYNSLKQKYGQDYNIFAKSELRDWKHFPKEKPDLYLRRKDKKTDEIIDYFADTFETSTSYGRMRHKIKAYIGYAERDSWQKHMKRPLPTILLVCENGEVKRKAQAITKREAETTFISMNFVFIDDPGLKASKVNG